MKIYHCKICGKEFKSRGKNPICCSRLCMNEYKKTDEYKQHLINHYKNLSEEQKLIIKQKREATMIKRYGCKHNWASENDEINGRGTIKKKYGGIGGSSEIIKKNIERTKLERYNDPHWCNPEKCSETYKNSSEEYKKKVCEARKQGLLEKYGVTSYYASEQYQALYKNPEWEEHRMKASYETKKKNNSFNSSKPELEILKLLQNKFPNTAYQYKSNDYPFNCDFFIPEKDLYIEYQGHWTHGMHPFDENSQTDLEKLNKWKNKKDNFYNIAINVWTIKDPLKRKVARDNGLNWIEFFTLEDFMLWYENV